jgi:hypothetical protein
MHVLHLLFPSKQDYGYVSNKGSHFRWWDPRAALPMVLERLALVIYHHRRP